MRRKTVCGVLGVAVVLVLFLALLLATQPWWWQHPWVFSVREAIDVNSGDVVQWRYVCGLRINEGIQMSPFSQELRRVGVHSSGMRNWKCTFTTVLGRSRPSATEEGYLIELCDFVLKVLDLHKASDAERSAILTEALANLQTGEVAQMKAFTERLVAKRDWEWGRRGRSEDQPSN